MYRNRIVPRGTIPNWNGARCEKQATIAKSVPRGTILGSGEARIIVLHGKSLISPAG